MAEEKRAAKRRGVTGEKPAEIDNRERTRARSRVARESFPI